MQIATDLCEANTKTSFTVPIEFCRLQSLFYAWLCHWHTVREQFAGSGLINEKEIDSRVFSIMACVEEQGYPRVIDYQKLARTVGLSRSQVDRVFLKNTGYTIHEWNDNQCLRKAELLLDNPALSVKEIAAELRFLTASHFTRWFSGKTRLTPQAWRKYHG